MWELFEGHPHVAPIPQFTAGRQERDPRNQRPANAGLRQQHVSQQVEDLPRLGDAAKQAAVQPRNERKQRQNQEAFVVLLGDAQRADARVRIACEERAAQRKRGGPEKAPIEEKQLFFGWNEGKRGRFVPEAGRNRVAGREQGNQQNELIFGDLVSAFFE